MGASCNAPSPAAAGSRTQDADLSAEGHEHGRWCVEVMRGLGLVPPASAAAGKGVVAPPPPLHVGVSFGAAVLLDLANVAPEAIRSAALLVPGGLAPGESPRRHPLPLACASVHLLA
jgi:pimeloyl-ACP methyl ester carboxylesterase